MAIDKKSYLERKYAAHRVMTESLDRETGMRAADLQADGSPADGGAGSSINNGLNYGREEEQGRAGEGPEDGGGGGVLPQEGFADRFLTRIPAERGISVSAARLCRSSFLRVLF